MKKLVCVLSIVSMTGCSAISAFQGTPDIVSLEIGMHKDEVEEIIDDVSTVKILGGGKREVVYSYIEKDASFFRSIGYFLGSVASFFILEPIFWTQELRRGDKNYATVVYDKNERAVSISTSDSAPYP